MSDKTGAPEAPDPCVWTAPAGPPETWSDADWLRDMARSNFVTEDIERADKIAARLETLEAAIAEALDDLSIYGGSYGIGDDAVANCLATLRATQRGVS
jgi:hypothetical protein